MLDAPKAFSKDTDEQIQKWIDDALERPSSFGLWSGHPHYGDMFDTWSLGPVIEHRDSPILDKANAEALRRYLAKDETLESEYYFTECNHWAVGWVTHLSFHACEIADGKREPTRMARIVREWFDGLAEYPCADESLWSEMESESAEEFWRSYQERDVKRELVKHMSANLDSADPVVVAGRSKSEIKDSIEDQIDAIDDETFWEIAVHRNGNGREIDSDGAYCFSRHAISELANTLVERGLVKI